MSAKIIPNANVRRIAIIIVMKPEIARKSRSAQRIAIIIVMKLEIAKKSQPARMAQMMTVLANAQRNASTVVPQTA